MHLNEIRNRVHDNAKTKGFWDKKRLNADELNGKLMLVVSEIAEACEEVRMDGFEPNAVNYSPTKKPEGFSIEIADAVIRLLDLCGALDIDIEQAIMLKHEYNVNRPHMHGKRA